MKSKLYFGLILLQFSLIHEMANAQIDTACWAWVKSLSATNGIYGHAIAIDPNGNGDIYIAGGFEGTTDFDPGPGAFTLSTGTAVDVGIFIAKYDQLGNFEWAKSMVGTPGSAASPRAIAVDSRGSGAIYTTGRFEGTVDFDPGPNTLNLKVVGSDDIFISKLDGEGNFVWARVIGGPGYDFGSSLAIDPGESGEVYITGQFSETMVFEQGDSFNLTSVGKEDIFISKLNKSGDFLWVKTLGGPRGEISHAISFDPSNGMVYTTGLFQDTVDFDPGPDVFNLIAVAGQYYFISKLDSEGNFVWAKQLGKVENGSDGSIALDPAGNGDVYITGAFLDTVDFDPGEETFDLTSEGMADIFISKLSGSGDFTWAKAMGGLSEDSGSLIAFQRGEEESIYTLGNFNGTSDFDSGSGSHILTSMGLKDIFISKLDNSGNYQWVKQIKGTGNEYVNAIAIDNNYLYLTGAYFGSSSAFDSIKFTNVSTGADLFMAKLDLRTIAVAPIDFKTEQLNLYPNPATHELNIILEGDEFYNIGLTMFNVLGEMVYFSDDENIGQKKTIDISGLSSGIYFLEFNFDGKRVIKKIVKE